ncbi:hypothetical protein KEH56_11840 [Burkholderia cenocepacia]|nr:hypothetical protein KEH56_11840 [Burkholderia cenocepacia]
MNLIGWSWGAALMGCYTCNHNDAVHKLVLLAPQWTRNTPSASDTGGKLGAYRIVQRSAAKARWLNGVPDEARDTLLPPAWFSAWADATFGPLTRCSHQSTQWYCARQSRILVGW